MEKINKNKKYIMSFNKKDFVYSRSSKTKCCFTIIMKSYFLIKR